MKIETGFIRLEMHHIPVQEPPDGLKYAIEEGLKELSMPRLCWMLQAVADELKSRHVDIGSSHGN